MDPIGGSTGKYGGSVREAGGSLGAMGAAREEMYFREQDAKKLQELKEKLASSTKGAGSSNEPKKDAH
jgi:hypothetical protein